MVSNKSSLIFEGTIVAMSTSIVWELFIFSFVQTNQPNVEDYFLSIETHEYIIQKWYKITITLD